MPSDVHSYTKKKVNNIKTNEDARKRNEIQFIRYKNIFV